MGMGTEPHFRQGAQKMFTQQSLVNEMESLRKFAIRLTRNPSEADDLLQSTVLRALEKKDYFQDGTDLFKWTSKIMFNLFVTDYRRKVRFESQYDPEDIIGAQSVDAEQMAHSELKAVGRAMEKLSEEHKEVLVLVCVKGMQYQEVAEMLSVPVGTIRSRLSRARAQLVEVMETPDHRDEAVAVYATRKESRMAA
jgi:RNA polymerase sigma-70 factor (ECF subfamily)